MSREIREKSRAPYEAPKVIRVHIDPVKELLQGTPCNSQDDACGIASTP
jgi:hypothetical protein